MILYLKDFFTAIQMGNPDILKSFGWGDYQEHTMKGVSYPFLNVFSETKSIRKGLTSINLTITVSDIVRNDSSNLDNVENSTLQLIRDIYNLCKIGLNKQDLRVDEEASIRFFVMKGGDGVAGHTMSLVISVYDGADICNNALNIDFKYC